MHSVHFHGQILTTQNHHTDTVSLFPGASTTAEMVADNPGHWLLTCTVNDHLMGNITSPQTTWSLSDLILFFIWLTLFLSNGFYPAGMQAIFEIKKCFPNVHKPRPRGELRQFFIAAEEDVWDYAPTPSNDGFVTVLPHWQECCLASMFYVRNQFYADFVYVCTVKQTCF